ncbi:MAG TPA: SigE family RNA polymerase sigma factor [Actinomycetota bacterium]|nr:SigE family RNA polymerase sigma factor [Actinomycetota bacterium]
METKDSFVRMVSRRVPRLGRRAADKGAHPLEVLFWTHGTGAFHLALLLTGERQTAEDLTQEAFVRVAGRFRGLANPDAFGPYLKKTVVNLARDHFRKQKRDAAFVRRQKQESKELWEEPEADRILNRSELFPALRRLPHRQRAAVVLRYCEGLSEQETADVLSTSVAATKSLTARGLKTLRTDLEGGKHA